jgi:hypothetical protein
MIKLSKIKTLKGCKLDSVDGEIGKVKECCFDDRRWTIRYLVAETGTWLAGRPVLASPQWIKRVSWSQAQVLVLLSREAVKQSPEFTDKSLLTQDYETGLHGHYNRKGYWVDELVTSQSSNEKTSCKCRHRCR